MRILYPYGEEFTGQRAREVHTLNRVCSLAEAGVEMDLVAGKSPRFSSGNELLTAFNLQPHPNLRIHFLPRQFGFGPFHFTSTKIFYSALGRWLAQQNRFDAAYAIHLKAADYLQDARPELPVVFEAHEIFADSFPEGSAKFEKLAAQEKRIYQRNRAVVATSQFLLGEIRNRYSLPTATLVSPNCVEEQFFQVPLADAESKRVIYVGSFQNWKGVDVAVAAMKLLPEFRLTIVGGQPEQVESLKRDAGSNVEFLGHQPRAEICKHLARASVALIPNRLTPRSSLYSFPMKLVEYAAAGRLVAASDIPVLRELKLGGWAWLVKPENPQALADGIRALAAESGGELRTAARNWARDFTWSKQAERIKDFLSGLVS